jgi:uncharacterized protein YqiB (DUF1249 family)
LLSDNKQNLYKNRKNIRKKPNKNHKVNWQFLPKWLKFLKKRSFFDA